MAKKEVCESHKSIAYYSGYWWIELKHIEYWIDDYIYRIDNAWYPSKWIRYHKSKILYDKNGDAYFRAWSSKIYFSECIRFNS